MAFESARGSPAIAAMGFGYPIVFLSCILSCHLLPPNSLFAINNPETDLSLSRGTRPSTYSYLESFLGIFGRIKDIWRVDVCRSVVLFQSFQA